MNFRWSDKIRIQRKNSIEIHSKISPPKFPHTPTIHQIILQPKKGFHSHTFSSKHFRLFFRKKRKKEETFYRFFFLDYFKHFLFAKCFDFLCCFFSTACFSCEQNTFRWFHCDKFTWKRNCTEMLIRKTCEVNVRLWSSVHYYRDIRKIPNATKN